MRFYLQTIISGLALVSSSLLSACGPATNTAFATPTISSAQTPNALDAAKIVNAARLRTRTRVRYDPKYIALSYPDGDVPDDTGVCTDVIIRSYRTALAFDLQKAVHEDMGQNFSAYPKNWGLKRPDKNIDHRRVPNLEAFFTRRGAAVKITELATDYKPGDIVSWRLGGRLPHIGIVTDKKTRGGTPLIVHNIGAGPVEDDILFAETIVGHFRFLPKPITAIH